MSISSKFSVAVHTLILISVAGDTLTSKDIAGSVNTNPVVIRRITGALQKANIIAGHQGRSGYEFLVEPDKLTLLDVYKAVSGSDSEQLFSMNENPNPNCVVGASIQGLLEGILLSAQDAMEGVLQAVTLNQLTETMKENYRRDKNSS